jgi:hypothetical protein
MRYTLYLGAILLCSLAFGQQAKDLREIRNVYLLPMSGGLDQYLADRIARSGKYTVVTDPNKADAIFTDRIGTGFERALDDLYRPPDTAEDTEADKFGAPHQKRAAGLGRARGTIFLVDRATRVVLWSSFVPVSGTQPQDVEKRARHIADELRDYIKNLDKHSPAPQS